MNYLETLKDLSRRVKILMDDHVVLFNCFEGAERKIPIMKAMMGKYALKVNKRNLVS